MIKTQQFNDFTEYNNYTLTSEEEKEQFFQTLVDFHKQGGNLELPVMHYDGTALSKPEEYFRKVFNDAEYIKRMVEHGMLSSPFSFRIDEKNNTIWTSNIFGLRKMAQKEIMKMYEDQIFKAVGVLVDNLKQCEKEPEILQSWVDYDNKYEEYTRYHPVITIAEHLERAEVYDIIFSKRPDYIELFKNTPSKYKETSQKKIEDMFIGFRDDINNGDMAMMFYKHGMADFIRDEGREKLLANFIGHVARRGDVAFLEKYFSDIDVMTLDIKSTNYESILRDARDYNTAKWLIDHNAFVIGNRHVISGSIDEDKATSVFSDELRTEVFEAILDHPQYQYLAQEESDAFFNTYGERRFNARTIMLLVDKYHASLDNTDAMSLGLKIQNEFNKTDPTINGVQWMLERGADPRNCENFIQSLINDRANGLSTLKKLDKAKIFNAFYPDPLFHMLDKSDVKPFFTYLEKVPEDAFSRYTKEGYPAWWGATKGQAISIIKNKIDYNQTSLSGVSYYTFVASKTEKVYDVMTGLLSTLQKNNPDAKFHIGKPDALDNNFLHHLLSIKTKKYLNTEFVDLFIAHTDTPCYEMLFQPNRLGVTPVEQIIQADQLNTTNKSGTSGNYLSNVQFYVSAFINDIVNHLDKIDFNKEVKPGVTVLNQVQELLKVHTYNHQNKSIELDKLFNTTYLTHKLDKELPENEDYVSANKMKI